MSLKDIKYHNPPSSRRDFSLDLIRSVAIIGIFFFHLKPDSIFKPIFTRSGDIGIVIFIALSGYVLGLRYLHKSISFKDFINRRLVRIMPAYWLSLLFILFASYILYNKIYPLADIMAHVFGVHALLFPVYANSISANLWFISLIITLYVCFPFLVKYLDRFNVLLVIAILLITHYVMLHVFSHIEYLYDYLKFKGIAYKYPLFIFNLLPFISGTICADLDRKGRKFYKILVGVIVAVYFYLIRLDNSAIGIIIFVFSLFVKKDIHFTPISYFARYSYEFYLLHHAFMATMTYYFYKYIHPNWTVFSIVYGTLIFIGAILLAKMSNMFTRFIHV